MPSALIEYVCYANVVRSPVYEQVTNVLVKERGLDGKVEAVSSGLTVERFNARQFGVDDIAMYFDLGLRLRPQLPEHAAFFDELARTLRDRKSLPFEALVDAACKSRALVDAYCARMRDEALSSAGLEACCRPQTPTRRRPDVTHVVALSPKFVAPLQGVYDGAGIPVVSVADFGTPPAGMGFTLKEFEAVVEAGREHVPRILAHFGLI